MKGCLFLNIKQTITIYVDLFLEIQYKSLVWLMDWAVATHKQN